MDVFLFCVLCFISITGSPSSALCPPPPGMRPPCDDIYPLLSISSSALCPPPPGMRPPCDDIYPLLSKRKPISVPDCRNTGCSQGYACCTDYCGGYTCIPAYTGPTHMCPPGGLSKCRRRRKADLSLPIDINSCHDDSDCTNGQLCCMVDCRKQCVTGWPIAYP